MKPLRPRLRERRSELRTPSGRVRGRRRGIAWLLAAASMVLGAPVDAQELELGTISDISELSLSDLLDVSVSIASAGRVQSLEEAPSIVSVVTAEDIRRMGARNLEDVLETVPGFEVITDELGRRRISVRGVVTLGTTENVLILLNGNRLNDHLWGGATGIHFNFPVQNLRQIEMIRGPGSALYGSNAFVAVVNMITWDAGSFDGTEVVASGGSYGTAQVSATTGHLVGEISLAGSVHLRRTDGYRLRVERDAATLFDQLNRVLGLPPISLAPGRTTDDRRELNAQLRAGWRGLTVDAILSDHHSGGFVGRINTLGTRSYLDTRQLILSGEWTGELSEEARVTLSAGVMREWYDEFLDPLPPGFVRVIDATTRYLFPDGVLIHHGVDEQRFGAGARLDTELGARNSLTVGVGFEFDETFDPWTSGNFVPTTQSPLPELTLHPDAILPRSRRTVLSAFVQDTWTPVPPLGVTAGLRLDRYDDFGSTVNPRLGLVWRAREDLVVKALYGRAFRAPTFSELSFGFEGTIRGNPDLDPATIHTSELAFTWRRPNLRLGVNAFATFVRDFIVNTSPLSIAQITEDLTFVNTRGMDVQGVEVEARRSFGFDHDVFGNYTFIRVEDLELEGTPGGLPEHMANVGWTLGVGDHLSVSPILHLRGPRRRFRLDPRPDVPGYGVLNANVRVLNLWETLELSVSLRNVLDKAYVDPAVLITMPDDYPMPGRHGFVQGSFKF